MDCKKVEKLITKESLAAIITGDNKELARKYVSKALIVLYRRQTAEEQQVGATTESNGRGFTGADAEWGTKCAQWMLRTNRWLTDNMLISWTKLDSRGYPRIAKYHKQINEAAEAKQRAAA